MKTPELSLRMLADDELMTVSGGRHCHKPPPCKWPGEKTVTQSNSVGDITVNAPDNSGSISVSVSQSNSA